MSNIEALRKMELPDEAYEWIDAIEEEISDLNDALKEAESDLRESEKEVEEKNDEIHELESKVDELEINSSIVLSGGNIRVDLSGLDYMTRESFKSWCQQHAITNSEPTFNL